METIEPKKPYRMLTDEEIICIRKTLKSTSFKPWSDSLAFAEALQKKFMEVNGLCPKPSSEYD